jgi:hypothetical protein
MKIFIKTKQKMTNIKNIKEQDKSIKTDLNNTVNEEQALPTVS